MGQTLFGGEVSGTPIETRAGTRAIGGDLLNPTGRLVAGASSSALGLDPKFLDLAGAAGRLLEDPGSRLRGLFASMEPFERRTTEEAVEGVRGGFGRLGGRFSRNVLEAEGRTRGELAGNFARSREQSLIDAEGQQISAMANILQALLGARGQTLDFFRPGAPNFREGALGDIIGAGGQIAAAGMLP